RLDLPVSAPVPGRRTGGARGALMSAVSISHHVTPIRTNLQVFGILILLTVVTAAFDYVDLGPLNIVVALLIAGTKATLVVYYFMHLRFSGKLTWAFAGLAVVFICLLIGMTFDDFLTREWIPQPSGWTSPPNP